MNIPEYTTGFEIVRWSILLFALFLDLLFLYLYIKRTIYNNGPSGIPGLPIVGYILFFGSSSKP